ncbi:FK506-binding protein 5, variant 2 [Schistosoma haematobium]|uniref:peptidylprolyl isomerase n=1 Tax=Schistosoma haematobium TaxID=6185 RepID=A0A6A5DH51_SCHHA|nr:FK506-binding protein 5, variant 2 [Schistosoma haematobium]KAH9584635.1 FK506-binding protein 5, variant 2 [Schistosoma haematobium]CAH8503730.1 unnamed protein product [Schistosoma haematobium]
MSDNDAHGSDAQQRVEDEYLKDFMDLSPCGDRGILKKVLREGYSDVKPCDGDTVVVHYVGTNYGGEKHGEVFDSSRARDEKFEFTIGNGSVIRAWDVGVATMKLGEICELIASPDYAYKDGKTLKFEVELFETLGADVSRNKDGSIRKSTIRKGKDIYNPVAGAEATIVFRNLTDSAENVEVTYCVGDPPLTVPEELDLCVRHMNTDEFSRVVVYKDKNSATEGADGHRVVYELTLKSFEKTKHLSGISSFSEQMAYANVLKEKANNFLKDSKFDSAIELYKRLDDELQYIAANGPTEQKELSAVIVAVRLNLALSYLKQCKPDKCIEFCKKVLDVFGNNEKALFRIGQAHLLRKDHEEASVYFKKIVESNPNNASAVKQLHMCEEEIRKAQDMAKKRFRSIFERCKDSGLDGVEEHKDGVTLNGEKSAL